jgi:hypothetical protein
VPACRQEGIALDREVGRAPVLEIESRNMHLEGERRSKWIFRIIDSQLTTKIKWFQPSSEQSSKLLLPVASLLPASS